MGLKVPGKIHIFKKVTSNNILLQINKEKPDLFKSGTRRLIGELIS